MGFLVSGFWIVGFGIFVGVGFVIGLILFVAFCLVVGFEPVGLGAFGFTGDGFVASATTSSKFIFFERFSIAFANLSFS